MDNPIEHSAEQQNNRPWLFKKGQSGNPSGRPKGTISLKEYAKRYLQELDEEGKKEFMEGLSKDVIWKMAEGNPKNDLDLNAKITMADVIKDLENGNQTRTEVIRQVVADVPAIQDTEQTERISDIPQEQSPAALPSEQVVEKYNPEEPPARIYD